MRSILVPLAIGIVVPAVPCQAEQDATITIERDAYVARFSPGHTEFRAPPARTGTPPPTLGLRYLGARRVGAEGHAADLGAVPERTAGRAGAHVDYRHGSVVERYRIADDEIEQSFVFEQPLQGQGDLVVRVGVDGNVRADPCPPDHRGLRFCSEDGPAICYSAAVAIDRRGLRVDVLTSHDGRGSIELTVPAAFVDAAAWPLVVDPRIGTEMALGPVGANQRPAVAYHAGTGRWLTAMSGTSSGSFVVNTTLVDSSGGFVTTMIASGLTAVAEPSVAACQCLSQPAFLVVWRQSSAIWARLVDATTGVPLATSFAVNTPGVSELCRRPTVCGAGDLGMFVAWDLTFAGQAQPRSIRSRSLSWPNPASWSAVSVGPQRVLQTVASGYVRSAQLPQSCHARFVAGGWHAIVRAVWERFNASPAPGDFDVETCSFRERPTTAQFGFLEPATGLLGASNPGFDEREPSIAALASRFHNPTDNIFCIAYNNGGDVLAALYNESTANFVTIPVRLSPLYESRPRVGAGFCEFTIAYEEGQSPTSIAHNIDAARMLRDGTVALDNSPINGLSDTTPGTVAISSWSITDGAVAQTNRTLVVWENNIASQGVRGRWFEPVGVSVSLYGVACPGPLGELAAIGSTGGLPYAGNANFTLTATGAPPNRLAVLAISDQFGFVPLPGAPGCTLYIGAAITFLPTVTSSAGDASIPVPIPCALPGNTALACQWGFFTPTVNSFGWVLSNDLDIVWAQ